MGPKRNIKLKPDSNMVHCQKGATLFQYIQEVSSVSSRKTRNYPRSDELRNQRSEPISKCWHANKYVFIAQLLKKALTAIP